MPGVVLNQTPKAADLENSQSQPAAPDDGEEAASPEEEQLLAKVMAAVYQSLNAPKKLRMVEAWLLKSKNLGADIGHIAFNILASIYHGAEQAGVKLSPDIFFAQGGAVYQTIDRIMLIAEHTGVPDPDPDKVREDALGTLVDSVRAMFAQKEASGQPTDMQGSQPSPGMPQQGPTSLPQQAAAANPMSAAVGQGLQQQGLLGGM